MDFVSNLSGKTLLIHLQNTKKIMKNTEEKEEADEECELLKLEGKDYLKKINYIKQINYKSFYKSGKTPEQLEKDIDIFFKNCSEYSRKPESHVPFGTKGIDEYRYISKILKNLGVLTEPCILADFLNIDVDIILNGIEKGEIPCFFCEGICSVKINSIIVFLKKYFPRKIKNVYNLTP